MGRVTTASLNAEKNVSVLKDIKGTFNLRDLTIKTEGDETLLVKKWYCHIPLFGRIWSWFTFNVLEEDVAKTKMQNFGSKQHELAEEKLKKYLNGEHIQVDANHCLFAKDSEKMAKLMAFVDRVKKFSDLTTGENKEFTKEKILYKALVTNFSEDSLRPVNEAIEKGNTEPVKDLVSKFIHAVGVYKSQGCHTPIPATSHLQMTYKSLAEIEKLNKQIKDAGYEDAEKYAAALSELLPKLKGDFDETEFEKAYVLRSKVLDVDSSLFKDKVVQSNHKELLDVAAEYSIFRSLKDNRFDRALTHVLPNKSTKGIDLPTLMAAIDKFENNDGIKASIFQGCAAWTARKLTQTTNSTNILTLHKAFCQFIGKLPNKAEVEQSIVKVVFHLWQMPSNLPHTTSDDRDLSDNILNMIDSYSRLLSEGSQDDLLQKKVNHFIDRHALPSAFFHATKIKDTAKRDAAIFEIMNYYKGGYREINCATVAGYLKHVTDKDMFDAHLLDIISSRKNETEVVKMLKNYIQDTNKKANLA